MAKQAIASLSDEAADGLDIKMPSSDEQLHILDKFIVSNRSAVNEDTIHFLISCAVDAFHNNDSGVARLYLRAAMFFEFYLSDPVNFLPHFRSAIPEQLLCPACKSYSSFLTETTPRIGVLEFLRSRISAYCICLNT